MMGYTRRDRIISFLANKNTKLVDKMEQEGPSPEALKEYFKNLESETKLLKQNIIRTRIVTRKLRESYGNI